MHYLYLLQQLVYAKTSVRLLCNTLAGTGHDGSKTVKPRCLPSSYSSLLVITTGRLFTPWGD